MTEVPTDLRLHSRYRPEQEAARYLDTIVANRHPSCLLVLGGSGDWLSEAARKRFPSSLVLSVQYDPSFRGCERPGADFYWYPDDPVALEAFLLRRISGRTDGGVVVVPWRPPEKIFPEIASRVLRTVHAVLEELSSDAATLRYWSFRWARNSIKNFLNADRFLSLPQTDVAVVIAAAGPSLEAALRLLDPFRDRIRIWSLSSASSACIRAGWIPELIVSTDAGFWSDRHFDGIRRSSGAGGIPLACLLTAYVPSRVLESCPVLLLSQGHPLQSDLAEASEIPSQPSSPRGTAAADALSLALSSTRGPVILAGLDMASLDLRSHCRPHGFDALLRKSEGRLEPGLGIAWERETKAFPSRSGPWRRGRSFDLYATGIAAGNSGRVLRALPSPVDVPGTVPASATRIRDLLSGLPPAVRTSFPEAASPSRRVKASRAQAVLSAWEDSVLASLRGSGPAALSDRVRFLLYALGGAEASGFLAQAARGVRDSLLADKAADAVLASLKLLREAAT